MTPSGSIPGKLRRALVGLLSRVDRSQVPGPEKSSTPKQRAPVTEAAPDGAANPRTLNEQTREELVRTKLRTFKCKTKPRTSNEQTYEHTEEQLFELLNVNQSANL